MIWSTRGSS